MSKWLLAPSFVLACCLTGCGSDSGTTVIEAPQQTEQQIADADAAYAEGTSTDASTYEAESSQ
jgi:hypothetical protein